MRFILLLRSGVNLRRNLDSVDQVSRASVSSSVGCRPLNDVEFMLLARGDGVLVCIQLYCSQLFNAVVSGLRSDV